MTQRERNLLKVLGGVAGSIVVMVILNSYILGPLRAYNQQIEQMEDDVVQKERQVQLIQMDMMRLEKARKKSLHAKTDQAVLEYGKYLQKTFEDSGVKVSNFQRLEPRSLEAGQNKKSGHMVLPFSILAEGTVSNLASALETLQRTPVMHRVQSMTLDRGSTKDTAANPKLKAKLTVEALILSGVFAKNEPTLKPDPKAPLTEGNSARQFADLSKRNPFTGPIAPAPEPVKVAKKETPPEPEPEPPEFDVLEYVRLVLTDPSNDEAFLRYSVFKRPEERLKSDPMSSYDTFRIFNEERKPILRGKVLRIDQRDVYYQIGEDVYGLHIGQTLAESKRRPLSDAEMKALSLTDLYNAEEAKLKGKSVPGKGGKSPGKSDSQSKSKKKAL